MVRKQIRIIGWSVVALLLLGFALFLINQVYQVHAITSAINPVLGTVITTILSLLIVGLLLVPIIIYKKLPKPIDIDGDDQSRSLKAFVPRLQRNNYLKEQSIAVNDEHDVPEAIARLEERADELVKATASSVFLTTAISQNGKLDALTVFVVQTKLVWDIAHLYYQRPYLKELINLYANVGAATFLAAEIEELDLSYQIEPVIKSFLKNSAGKAVPVIGPTANIIFDSLLEGSTNAFLTLRVGIIAKKYCGQPGPVTRKVIKKQAIKEASLMLGGLVVQSSGKVFSTMMRATKKAGVDTVKTGVENIQKSARKVRDGIVKTSTKINPFVKGDRTLPEADISAE